MNLVTMEDENFGFCGLKKKSFTFLSFFFVCLISVRDVCPCVCDRERVCLCARMMHVCEGDGLTLVKPLVCYYLLYHKLYE